MYKLNKIGRVTPGLYIEATSEYGIWHVDASSCYPSVMLFCGSNVQNIKYPERLKHIYSRRLELKSIYLKDDGTRRIKDSSPTKLVLNTTYGAMGNKYLTLYDCDYMRSKTCRVGQMILLSISNKLYTTIPDVKLYKIIQMVYMYMLKRSDLDKIKAIMQEFIDISHLHLTLKIF